MAVREKILAPGTLISPEANYEELEPTVESLSLSFSFVILSSDIRGNQSHYIPWFSTNV